MKVVQPLKEWQDRLKQLSSQLPPSLSNYMHWTIANAEAEWLLVRIRFLEKDIDLFSQELAKLNRDLQDHESNIRALQKAILMIMPQLVDDYEEMKSSGLHYRSRVLANDYLYAVAEVVRCLDDSTLIRIRQELVERRKWTLGNEGYPFPKNLWFESRLLRMVNKDRKFRVPAFRSGIDTNLFQGAHLPQTLEALMSLWSARHILETEALTISQLLHVWRQQDSHLYWLRALPYLFSHQRAYDRVHELRVRYFDSLNAANNEFKVFGSLLFIRAGSPLARLYPRWQRMNDMFRRMLDNRFQTESLFSATFCQGMSALLLTPTSALERSLIAMYRPFYVGLADLSDLHRLVRICYDGPGHLQLSLAQGNVLLGLADSLQADLREMNQLLKTAVPMSGAFALYFGKLYRPRSESRLATAPVELPYTFALEPSGCMPPVKSIDSLFTSSFYAKRKAVSVSYVSDLQDATSAFRSLNSCKTLAFDAIVMEYTDTFNVRSSHIEFILVASEEKVVICHAGLLESFGHLLLNLGSMLEDPYITKVGLNTGFLQRQLFQECNWDVQGCVNLAGGADSIITLDDLSDPTQELLAELGQQHLGMKVPATTDARALLSEGVRDPLGHFRYLAARAYLPLLLHRTAQARQESNDGHTSDPTSHAYSPPKDRAPSSQSLAQGINFGPVCIGTRTYARSVVTSKSRVIAVRSSRKAYLGQLTKQLAEAVLQKAEVNATDTFLKYLQAYYLLTTFGQSLRSVMQDLRPESIDHLYRGILLVAAKFNLMLFNDHRDRLGAEAISLGARRTVGKRQIRSIAHRPPISEQSATPRTDLSGSGLPEIGPVPPKDMRIGEDTTSSNHIDEQRLTEEKIRGTRKERERVRRREKRRERQRTVPGYRAAKKRRLRENQERRKAELAKTVSETSSDDDTPTFVMDSLSHGGPARHSKNAMISWASHVVRNEDHMSGSTVVPAAPPARRVDTHVISRRRRDQVNPTYIAKNKLSLTEYGHPELESTKVTQPRKRNDGEKDQNKGI